jgi:alkanesulfonate monooxygenase SsuD/methylene tetrahydromethanopterin reductase-like flavin-dependent oxidoreductase (luciferase family)
MGFTFGVNTAANAPFDVLRRRWQLVEELGFENAWVPDHTASFAGGGAIPCYDGWTVLAAMACHTATIRIGTMVSNPVLRHPTILAKQALAVDALSGGRLELGIGTGIAEFDADAVGEPLGTVRDRTARLAEYVDVVASLLDSPEPRTFEGDFYRLTTLRSPEPVQHPRPPITIGGQHRRVIEVAAKHADRWNTHGPAGAELEEILAKTAQQVALLEELAEQHGRRPETISRTLMGAQALDVWSRDITVPEICERFAPLGFTHLVLGWPGEDRVGELERLAGDVLPGLREAASEPSA